MKKRGRKFSLKTRERYDSGPKHLKRRMIEESIQRMGDEELRKVKNGEL